MNNKYAKAYKEVLEIIKYFPEEEYDKIPIEKIEFYKKNMDKDYDFKINPKISLQEQNISKEANIIIVRLYLDYFATEEQKIKIYEILKLNELKAEQEKSKKYGQNDIFKKKDVEKNIELTKEKIENTTLVEYKENLLKKMQKIIYKLLHIYKD